VILFTIVNVHISDLFAVYSFFCVYYIFSFHVTCIVGVESQGHCLDLGSSWVE
jgi:hypothetical protein